MLGLLQALSGILLLEDLSEALSDEALCDEVFLREGSGERAGWRDCGKWS